MIDPVDNVAARRFDRIAANYASSEVHRQSASLRLLHDLLGEMTGGTVVDVACGAGHSGYGYAATAERLIFCDPSPAMLDIVERRAGEGRAAVETHRCVAERLPLRNGVADLVVSRLAPHHFADPAAAVSEMLRVARPDGHVAIIDLEGSADDAADLLNHRLELLHDPTHVRSYTAARWCRWLRDAGGTIDYVQGGVHESADGVTVRRWCEIAGSDAASGAINALLDDASATLLAQLAIRHDGREWRMPVRTVMLIARRS